MISVNKLFPRLPSQSSERVGTMFEAILLNTSKPLLNKRLTGTRNPISKNSYRIFRAVTTKEGHETMPKSCCFFAIALKIEDCKYFLFPAISHCYMRKPDGSHELCKQHSPTATPMANIATQRPLPKRPGRVPSTGQGMHGAHATSRPMSLAGRTQPTKRHSSTLS